MYSYEKKVYTLMIINSTNINKTNKFEWPFLESRRANFRTTMMYIMTKYLTSVDTSDKLIPLQRPSRTPWHSAFHHAEHPYGRNHSIQKPPRI